MYAPAFFGQTSLLRNIYIDRVDMSNYNVNSVNKLTALTGGGNDEY